MSRVKRPRPWVLTVEQRLARIEERLGLIWPLDTDERRQFCEQQAALDKEERLRNAIYNALEDLTAPMVGDESKGVNRATRALMKAVGHKDKL